MGLPEEPGDVLQLTVSPEVRTVGPGVGQVPGGSAQLTDHQSELGADHPAFLPQFVASEHSLGLAVLLTEPADFVVSQPPGSGVAASTAGTERHPVRIKGPEQRVGRQWRI